MLFTRTLEHYCWYSAYLAQSQRLYRLAVSTDQIIFGMECHFRHGISGWL